MKNCPASKTSYQHRGLCYALLIAVMFLGGCGSSTRVEEHSTQSITTSPNPKVVIQNFQGKIDITTHEQATIDVEVTKIATDDTRAKALAQLKDIEVSLTQENGTVNVTAHRIQGVSMGALEAQLIVRVPARSWITVMSGMGDVTFQGELPDGEHSFQSGSGNILLALPETISFRINALTGNGKISSEIPITRSGEEGDNILIGTSGENPNVSITTTTSNGDITLHVK